MYFDFPCVHFGRHARASAIRSHCTANVQQQQQQQMWLKSFSDAEILFPKVQFLHENLCMCIRFSPFGLPMRNETATPRTNDDGDGDGG